MSDANSGGTRAPVLWAGLEFLRRRAAMLARSASLPANSRSLLLYALMPALSGVNAVVGLVIPALLGPADFGQYSIAVTLFQYGLIFDFGISQLIDRRVPVLISTDRPAAARFIGEALWVRLYIASGGMIVAAALMYGLASRGRLPFSLLAGLLSLAAGLSFMLALGPTAVYRATSRRREFALAGAAGASALAIMRPAGMVLGGISECFAGLLACYAAMAAFLQLRMPIKAAQRPGLRQAVRLLLQGLPLFATSFVWAFYMTANRWVVSFLAPPLDLGHFAFASNMAYLLVGTLAMMSQFYYPAIVGRAATGGTFSMSRVIARDLCALAVLVALPTAVGIVVGPRLIELAYRTFLDSAGAVRIILVAVPSLTVSSWLMPLSLSTATRPWIEGALIYPAALLVLVASTWGGYHLDGIAGASWGLSASAPALLVLQVCNLRVTRLLSWRHAIQVIAVASLATALLAALALWAGAPAGVAS